MQKHNKHEGIPRTLTLDEAADWVKPRVSEKRFRHIEGVVEIARRLSPVAGCDQFLAELSSWLHDACKEVKDTQLVAMADEAGMKLHAIERKQGHILHGPVAAITVSQELSITNKDVLEAISQHTLGFVPMSQLSKVVYLADCLEIGRPKDYTDPIWIALDLGGANNLDKAIVVACDLGIRHLIEKGKPIHPRTIEVRNYYLNIVGRDS